MGQSIAEAYLLLFRGNMVPVIGEAIPTPFQFQIELSKWHWELKYEEKASDGKAAKTSKAPEEKAAEKDKEKDNKPAFNGVELIKAVQKMQESGQYPKQTDRDKRVRDLIKKATDAQSAADAANDDEDGDGSAANALKFTFDKNVDAATTQLLNSMKAGERLPRAILTLFHRSTNAPVTLVVTFGNLLLTNYSVSVDPEETMAEMRESWTAEYDTVDYVYQNRPAAAGWNGVTKGTARVFKMKLKSFF